jgi:hypothetical protein
LQSIGVGHREGLEGVEVVSVEDYLSLMPTSTTLPQILEDCWTRAMPGREAAAVNELLRSLRELLIPREVKRRVTI